MDIITEPLPVEHTKGPVIPHAQPIDVLGNLDAPLDDKAVREALVHAEKNNLDPMSVTMADLVAQSGEKPAATAEPSQPQDNPEIPEKFRTPDGAVDVEKLEASARQLDEATQKKEEKLQAVNKTVDDLWNHYKESERKFKNLPNPDKIAAQLPQAPTQPSPQQMSDEQLRQMIAQDMQRDPVGTTTSLIDLIVARKLQPLEERENDARVRENIAQLAAKDPRILKHYDAVTAKLDSDPDLRRLKNPHKAAWLEVKEELRLGEPLQAPAQPSKPLSPVLGGGTPPSAPSSSAPSPQNVLANLDKLDLRDKRQEAMADEAIKQFLSRSNRF